MPLAHVGQHLADIGLRKNPPQPPGKGKQRPVACPHSIRKGLPNDVAVENQDRMVDTINRLLLLCW